MKTIKIGFLVLLLPLLLDACTTIHPLSAVDRKQIHRVAFNKKIEMPEKMFLMDPSIVFAGPLISAIVDENKAGKLQKIFIKKGYFADKVMLAELKKAIKEKTPFHIINSEKSADAILKLRIRSYGFGIPHGFAGSMAPALSVDATMYRKNKIVWHFENYKPVIDVKRVTMDKLFKDPKLGYLAWDAAAKKLANEMVKSM